MTATTRPLLVHAPGTPASHPHGASGEETTPQLWSRMVRAVLERANAEKEVAEMAGAEQGGARIEQAGPYAGREGVSAGGRGVHAEGRGRAEGVGARARGGRGRAGGRRAVESTHEGKGGRGKQQKISGRNGARSTAAQSFKRDVRSSHDLTTPYLGRSGPITIPRRQITFSRLKVIYSFLCYHCLLTILVFTIIVPGY